MGGLDAPFEPDVVGLAGVEVGDNYDDGIAYRLGVCGNCSDIIRILLTDARSFCLYR